VACGKKDCSGSVTGKGLSVEHSFLRHYGKSGGFARFVHIGGFGLFLGTEQLPTY
jgi:hypothetical protein